VSRAILDAVAATIVSSHEIVGVGWAGTTHWGSPYSAQGYARAFDQTWFHWHQSTKRFAIGETV
jgi:deoxycytidylate deaminase